MRAYPSSRRPTTEFASSQSREGLSRPWSLAFLPNGDMLVTEKDGRLRLITDDVLRPEPVQGVPEVDARSQGGLMDVVLHPQFAENRLGLPDLIRNLAKGDALLEDSVDPYRSRHQDDGESHRSFRQDV